MEPADFDAAIDAVRIATVQRLVIGSTVITICLYLGSIHLYANERNGFAAAVACFAGLLGTFTLFAASQMQRSREPLRMQVLELSAERERPSQ